MTTVRLCRNKCTLLLSSNRRPCLSVSAVLNCPVTICSFYRRLNNRTCCHLSSLCSLSDLYHSWVAPTLQSDLLVQFWIRSTGVLPSDCSEGWKVLDITLLNPGQVFTYKTSQDHSKWAVSPTAAGQGGGWVCVGDINRNEAEEKRGGGTVCLQDPVVWKAYRTAALDCESCDGETISC